MRNVYRSKEHRAMITLLTGEDHKDPDSKAFETIKELQCYAALLGFERNQREKFERGEDKAESIKWSTFNSAWHGQCVYLIAVAEIGNMKVLSDDSEENSDEDMVGIFEEYAHGGFNIIQRWLNEKPGDIYGTEALIQGLKKDGLLKRPIIDKDFIEPEF